MNLPAFITFTGADDNTSIEWMSMLSVHFPIEWGILFSRSRAGTPRYPSLEFVQNLVEHAKRTGLKLSAHLCGEYAREVLTGQEIRDDGTIEEILADSFDRVQINSSEPRIDTGKVKKWAGWLSVTPILQCRENFPTDINVEWLLDASGGRGILPESWPFGKFGGMVGYAGGLNPSNVKDAVKQMAKKAPSYWIDMETGVRDENDRFDLARCRAVCEAVYGRRS